LARIELLAFLQVIDEIIEMTRSRAFGRYGIRSLPLNLRTISPDSHLISAAGFISSWMMHDWIMERVSSMADILPVIQYLIRGVMFSLAGGSWVRVLALSDKTPGHCARKGLY